MSAWLAAWNNNSLIHTLCASILRVLAVTRDASSWRLFRGPSTDVEEPGRTWPSSESLVGSTLAAKVPLFWGPSAYVEEPGGTRPGSTGIAGSTPAAGEESTTIASPDSADALESPLWTLESDLLCSNSSLSIGLLTETVGPWVMSGKMLEVICS